MLKSVDAYYFYPVASGWMSSGVPDIIACYKGKFLGIECKAGKNGTSALQDKNLEHIIRCGGIALVINETNLDKLREVLDGIT